MRKFYRRKVKFSFDKVLLCIWIHFILYPVADNFFLLFEFDRWNWQHCLHTKLTPTLNDIRSIIKKISFTISVHTNNKIDIIINYYLQNVPIFSAANNIECHNIKCKYWKCLLEILKAMRLEIGGEMSLLSSVKLLQMYQKCLLEGHFSQFPSIGFSSS